MKVLAWDIETSPHEVYRWGLFDQSPVGLSQIIRPGGVMCFAARWLGEPKSALVTKSVHYDGHQEMVQYAWDLLNEADALLSWNGKGFDTRRMQTEFTMLGMTKPEPWAEIDMLKDVRREFAFPSNKLEYVAQTLLGKGKVSHEGFGLWLKCLAGDPKAWDRMLKYNAQDVHLLIELYEYLKGWIKTPNARLFGSSECTKAGCDGTLAKEGTRTTLVGVYQRYKCNKCGSWSTSGESIERTDIR